MKIHVLSNPHRPTTTKYADFDPFAIIAREYVYNMQERGYEIIHYGLEGSEVECEHYSLSNNLNEFNLEASKIIQKRKSSDDIIACFYGLDNQDATLNHPDLKIIEPAIGYDATATFARYKVYKSYAHMHYHYGLNRNHMNPDWYDAVIPWGRDPKEFTFKYNFLKEDYFLCFGRITNSKGIQLAIDATKAAGVKLKIAGPGSLYNIGIVDPPSHVEVFGICDSEQRRELMSNAKAIIGATQYLEPFGLMVVEGYFSGTPAITTDWGAFPETVVQNKTGYRCRNFREFVDAIKNINDGKIRSIDCYRYAMENYSNKVVFDKHDDYIKRIFLDFYE